MNIKQFIIDAAWAICSAHHTVLSYSSGAVLFDNDMLIDLLYLADWKVIIHKKLVGNANKEENAKYIEHNCAIGCIVLISYKESKCNDGHNNSCTYKGTIKIQHGHVTGHFILGDL